MGKLPYHKALQAKAAGPNGETEKKIRGNRLLDAKNPIPNTATEIERCGKIDEAIVRLKTQKNASKVLQVPQPQMPLAKEKLNKAGVKATVKNLSGTRRMYSKGK